MANKFLETHDIISSADYNEKVVSANGIEIYTESGKTFYYYNEISSLLGQNNKKFIKRLQGALEKGIYTPVKGYDEQKESLYKKLIKLTNNDFDKIFLSTSGSESVEWAVRLARNFTGKNEIIAFSGSLHGRTYLAACLSGIDRRKEGLGIKAPEIIHGEYPNCSRCFMNLSSETCGYSCINYLDKLLDAHSSNDVAAVLIEPFTGSTGMVVPPEGYLTKLKEWAKDRGALLIFDEIQTAFGKTGNMFMYQKEQVVPDILVLGKGMGNGMPISGLMTTSEILKNIDGNVLAGGTGSNPIMIEAVNSVLDILEEDELLNHVVSIEHYIKPELKRWCDTYDVVDNFRGAGTVYGIEFVYNGKERTGNNDLVSRIIKTALKKGIILGRSENILFFRPAMCVSLEQTRKFITIVEQIIKQKLL